MNFLRSIFSKNKINIDLVCPICLVNRKETRNIFISIKCGHIYCISCLDMLRVKLKYNCPLCNIRITGHLNLLYYKCISCSSKVNLKLCEQCSSTYCKVCIENKSFKTNFCKKCNKFTQVRKLFL